MPTLSIIIVSYNTKDLLEECLDAVYASKNIDKKDLEVIVVDNNSSDGSSEMVNKKFTQVKLIRNNENIGYSAGNNIGMTVSTGSYVLLLNSDAFVRPETLKTMLNYMEQDPAIGASTCRVELPSGKLDPACHRGLPTPWNAFTYFTGLERLFPASRIFGGYHQSWKDLTISHEVDSISGAFFLVRREVVQKVGLLDEQFFMYGEDIDWCYLIKQSGFHIMFNPSAKVLHYKKQSGRARSQESGVRSKANYHFVHTMEQFYWKHYVEKYPRLINWLVLAGINSLKLLVSRHFERRNVHFRRRRNVTFRSREIQAPSWRSRSRSLALDPSTTPSTRSARSGSARDDEVKKVIIDARLAGLQHAGIGRYVQSLIEGLEVQSSKFKVQSLEIKAIAPNIKHYSLEEQIFLLPELLALKPDLVHFPHFNVPLLYQKPFVVTIHDLLWHEQVGMDVTTLPAWLYAIKYLGYRLVIHHAISDSKAIIVPSRWVEKKVLQRFPGAARKIHVIYEGVSGAFKGQTLRTQGLTLINRYGLKPSYYLIYAGSLYPHKNVGLILNVVQHFTDLKFVVACSRSVFWEKFREDVRQRGLTDRVILAGFVQDEELVTLYQHALAFVFPSLSEGFGLPGLEAMAAGCPVLSSSAGALPEIYGDAALYFDPKNGEDLIEKIKIMKDKEEMRKRMIELGKKRAKQFNWEKCAEETMGIYQKVLRAPAVRSPLPWSASTRRGVATAGFGRTS